MASGDDATQKLELAPGTEGSHQLGVSSSRPGRGAVNSMSRSSFAVPSLFSANRDHPQGRFRFQSQRLGTAELRPLKPAFAGLVC